MANLDRIAKVNINLKTTAITEAGFGTMLVAGMHVNKLGKILVYTDVDELLQDGFTEDSEVYKAVKAALMQSPKPSNVKVGKIQCDKADIEVLDVAAGDYIITVQSLDNSFQVVSDDYKYTAQAGDDETDIVSGLIALITADAGAVVGAEVQNGKVQLTNKTLDKDFAVKLSDNLKISALTKGTASIGENLTAINSVDSDWYGLVLASHVKADILAAADWIETKNKIFGTSINEAGAKSAESTNDTGAEIKAKNYFRTHWWYHGNVEEYMEAAILAVGFSYNPGSETWANKKLAGISSDNLTEGEFQAIKNKNGNTFESFGSFSITQNGKVAGGEWIDVIRFRDWLHSKIQANVVTAMVNSPKIPYTDGGINIIESVVLAALKEGQNLGGIAPTEFLSDGTPNPGYIVSVPLSSDVSQQDKASRTLKNIRFTARLSGAIHLTEVNGSLGYENLV